MSGLPPRLAALALALAAGGEGARALPAGAARYRMELGGVPVGLVELAVRCRGPACAASLSSWQRLPAEAGGGVRSRRVDVAVDGAGRADGAARVAEEGRVREVALPRGAVPSMLAETLLAPGAGAGPAACLDVVDEASGARRRDCAAGGARGDGWRGATIGGEEEWIRAGPAGFPAEIAIPGQRVRFLLDPAAALPARAPRLYGTAVAGPDDPRDAGSFCGLPRDPPPPAAGAGALPPPRAPGASCREQTAAWLEVARAAGFRGRRAAGVAHDGAGFVWHEWAEVAVGGRWIPVDPAFRQSPARGPRYTVATWEEGDAVARGEAARRILACWGRARVAAGVAR